MILVRFFSLIFLFFSCSSSSEQIIDQVESPWGYVFTEWEGAPIDVITYIPPNATPGTPILMVIPGASRDAQRFHASWLDLAKKIIFLFSLLEQKRVSSLMNILIMLEV